MKTCGASDNFGAIFSKFEAKSFLVKYKNS